MFFEETQYKYWRLRTWRCCGHLWELLLSKKFPEREKWQPRCDTCGSTGSTMNTKILKIGIVGARKRNTQKDKDLIKKALERLLERAKKANTSVILVSGGCKYGGDAFAEQLALELKLPIQIHYPKLNGNESKWACCEAYFARNSLIAVDSDIILATPNIDSKSEPVGGTGDTCKKARELGKPVIIL